MIFLKNFLEISSKDNPLIKFVCSLQSSAKSRKENKKFVLEGLRICKDAYENNIEFDKLIVSESAFSKHSCEIEILSEKAESCVKITDKLFKSISDTDSPQGIIAVANMRKTAVKPKSDGRYVALENLQDPSNLGAVSRTAEAFGASGIIVSGGCDIYSPKVLRASMGTMLRMDVIETDSIIKLCRENGIKTYACVVDRDVTDIGTIEFKNGSAVIIGNEANGISEQTKTEADEKITIGMSGNVESLNAAAAASVAIYLMMK